MRRQKTKLPKIALFLAIIIIVLGVFIYNSKTFERNNPTISLDEHIYWNLKTPLKVKIQDDVGIRHVLAELSNGETSFTLENSEYKDSQKELEFNITFPKREFYSKKNEYTLTFEVVDNSFWNFFMGNKIVQDFKITVDTKSPSLSIIENSYKVTKGGVGAVIFKAGDENIDKIYINTSFNKQFKAVKFEKEGYYIALVAWPRNENSFSAEVVVTDLAGNVARERIRYFLQDKNYKSSTIALTDTFLNSVSMLAPEEAQNLSNLEKFTFINNDLRRNSVLKVAEVTDNINYDDRFNLRAFFPLRNGAVIASYGDHRIFEEDKTKVSESYHLGLDIASTAESDIVLSNKGKVVLAEENGIYGKTIIIDHGLGIHSLYGHCSSILVNEGDEVIQGQIIGRTGKTGFAFGDHLHFGIVIQGVEVRPEEWLDDKWLRDNIFDLIENAKKVINSEK